MMLKTEAAIEEMAAENQELRQKLEAMAKKIEVLEGTKWKEKMK